VAAGQNDANASCKACIRKSDRQLSVQDVEEEGKAAARFVFCENRFRNATESESTDSEVLNLVIRYVTDDDGVHISFLTSPSPE
jgi:hypothetical protein